MAQTAVSSTSYRNTLLRIIIWALTLIDKVTRFLFYAWYRLLAGPGKAKPGGSNPAPPKTMGIIITEPNIADVSLRTVANIAAWCMSYGAQQVHLYDPSGHLKRSESVLVDNLHTAAAQEGRTVLLKCGWSVVRTGINAAALHKPLQQPITFDASATAAAAGPAQPPSNCTIHQRQHAGLLKEVQACMAGCPYSSQQLSSKQQHPQACNGRHHRSGTSNGEQLANGSSSRGRGGSLNNQHPAGKISSSSSSSQDRRDNVASAVTVRLLAAEDAYDPVIAATLERCADHIIPGSSPKANSLSKQAKSRQQLLLEGSSMCNGSWPYCSSSSKKLCQCGSKAKGSQCCEAIAYNAVAEQDSKQMQRFSCSCSSRKQDGTGGPCGCHVSSCNGVTGMSAAGDSPVAADSMHQLQPHVQLPCDHNSSLSGQRNGYLKNGICRLSILEQMNEPEPTGSSQSIRQQEQQQPERPPQQQQQQHPAKLHVPLCSLAQQQHTQQKQDGSILPELAELVDQDILLEPQLLLVYGPVLSLAGYPPFHTRAAEVQYMGSLVNASRQLVANAIAGYCRVLQRHGA